MLLLVNITLMFLCCFNVKHDLSPVWTCNKGDGVENKDNIFLCLQKQENN